MSMFNCSDEMDAFHGEEIRLTTADRTDMRERRNNGRVRLRTGLERDGYAVPDQHSQGSYAMHTMVQDPESDYDIDDGAYFQEADLKDSDGNTLSALAARERVCKALTQDNRLANPAKVHRNCVRQVYPEGYHIDIPVYRVMVEGESKEEYYELARDSSWTRSDARAVTRWFNDRVKALNGETDDGRQMRRVTRLTKGFSRSRTDWKAQTTSGITVTRLVSDEFVASPGREDVSLRETWTKIRDRLAKSRVVKHPVNDENLAEQDDQGVKFLHDKLTEALNTLQILDAGCTRGEARQAWDDVFNTSFFSDQPEPEDGDGEGGKSAFVATSNKSDRRDDAGGRYG